MSISSMDLASARTLILAFLTNSDDDTTAEYADSQLKILESSKQINSFETIVECGHEFAKIYDFEDREMITLREKFEEVDELTWSKFESLMDSSCGTSFDVKAISLFLAIINQIRVPTEEIDDLIDLATWYASTRVSPFVIQHGGWISFHKMIEEVESRTTSNIPRLDQLLTMSQFERTIQEVEMGSMVVLQEENTLTESNSTLTQSGKVSLSSSTEDNVDNETIERHSNDECTSNERTASIGSSVFDNQEVKSEVHSLSSDRLSGSPVLITPPDTGTPVYISSQPESLDLDQNSNCSLDASLINELMENCQNTVSGNSDEMDEIEFNINRSDTVRTLKSNTACSQSKTQDQPSTTMATSCPTSVGESLEGIRLESEGELDLCPVSKRLESELDQEEDATDGDDENSLEYERKYFQNTAPVSIMEKKVTTSQVFSHDVTANSVGKQANYFILAGAAVVGLAAVYLKTVR